MITDDERQAEIETVAQAFGYRPTPPGEWARALRMAEGAITALDRVRDARRDDTAALLEATKREAACGRELAAAHARIAELEAARP